MKALSLSAIKKYERLAKKLGVSVVARSKRGFMTQFKKAGGKISGLSTYWKRRRENFIKRHYAQVKKRNEKLFKDGVPTRRHLAFIFWAWSPYPKRLTKFKRQKYVRRRAVRRTRRNPDVEYHDRTNKYRGVTYMSIGHDGDGILWVYSGGKILTHDSYSEDEEEVTHDTAFGPGHFWQGRYETQSGALSILPPYRSEDRKVPVKILNLLISTFRPKKIYAFI